MPRSLEGAKVVVTGASRGIGRATAELFAERDGAVVLTAGHENAPLVAAAVRLTKAYGHGYQGVYILRSREVRFPQPQGRGLAEPSKVGCSKSRVPKRGGGPGRRPRPPIRAQDGRAKGDSI